MSLGIAWTAGTPAIRADEPLVSIMDGILRQINPLIWIGELHDYRVKVFQTGGRWYVAIEPGGRSTEVVLPVASLADGARRARQWIEKRLRA